MKTAASYRQMFHHRQALEGAQLPSTTASLSYGAKMFVPVDEDKTTYPVDIKDHVSGLTYQWASELATYSAVAANQMVFSPRTDVFRTFVTVGHIQFILYPTTVLAGLPSLSVVLLGGANRTSVLGAASDGVFSFTTNEASVAFDAMNAFEGRAAGEKFISAVSIGGNKIVFALVFEDGIEWVTEARFAGPADGGLAGASFTNTAADPCLFGCTLGRLYAGVIFEHEVEFWNLKPVLHDFLQRVLAWDNSPGTARLPSEWLGVS